MQSRQQGWIDLSSTPLSRRKFLSLVAAGGIFTSLAAGLVATARSVVPNVLYEPPSKFRAGKPEDYPLGSVTFVQERNVYIQRDERGLFAMSAVCTHLGCTVPWVELNNDFECPCHGGKYRRDGQNYAGPPPRPLERLQIQLDPTGRIVVDTAKAVGRDYRLNA